MKRSSYLIAASLTVLLAVPAAGLAQAPTTDKANAPVTGMKPDRTTAPTAARKAMQEKEAVKRQKRAECRAKAKAEHVKLLKRPAFVKKCTSQSG
jgi:acyl-CoA hydrolase